MRNIDMSYYNIYYYCSIADNLLTYFTSDINWLSTAAQFTDSFFLAEPESFPKYTALHSFCEFVIQQIFCEDTRNEIERIQEKYDMLVNVEDKKTRLLKSFNYDNQNKKALLEIDRVGDLFGMRQETFFDYLLNSEFTFIEDAYENFLLLDSYFSDIVMMLSQEMFYVLFLNRDFLFRFNYWLANSNPYKIKRSSIPVWVKRAVKYRDKGRCVICDKDLSGLLDIEDDNSVHYDHIISLNDNGLNDITNIQLMCHSCNLNKGDKSYTSTKYKYWYNYK